MAIIAKISCTIGVIIAQGPSLELVVFFLVCDVITFNPSEEKEKKSHPTKATEPEWLLTAEGLQRGLIYLNIFVKIKECGSVGGGRFSVLVGAEARQRLRESFAPFPGHFSSKPKLFGQNMTHFW